MPLRKDQVGWGKREKSLCSSLAALGIGNPSTAKRLNAKFHKGKPVRTAAAVGLWRTKHGIRIAKRPKGAPEAVPSDIALEQRVERTETADGTILFTAIGQRIKTLDDLAKYAELDMTQWEWFDVTTNVWDTTTVDRRTGRARKIQNYQIKGRVRLKAGPSTREQVEAVIAGALAKRKPVVPKLGKAQGNPDILQAVAIADPHIGKLAWPTETGSGPYDTPIAVETLRTGVGTLIAEGDARDVGERAICLLGDFLHHDGRGMTTKGTVLDYDSRIKKLLREGTELLFDLIAASAERVPTRVYVVPGNHDTTLTWAVQELLHREFRTHRRVTVDDRGTSTRFFQWGRCLIGLDHGDKGKKRLPDKMVTACEVEWGQTIVREILTGHLHSKAAIDTMGGIVVRTMDSLATPDAYHAEEKFDSSPRTIEAFRYHRGGMLAGTDSWSPDLNRAPRRGTA